MKWSDLLRLPLDVVAGDDSTDSHPPKGVHGTEDVIGVVTTHILKETVHTLWSPFLQALGDAHLILQYSCQNVCVGVFVHILSKFFIDFLKLLKVVPFFGTWS